MPDYSFPMGSVDIGALMMANSSLIEIGDVDTLIVAKQGPIWAVLAALGIYLYIVNHCLGSTKEESLTISKLMLNVNIYVVGMAVLLYLTFMATTIAVTMFQSDPKTYPFKTFDELADAVLAGRIKIVGIEAAAISKSAVKREK